MELSKTQLNWSHNLKEWKKVRAAIEKTLADHRLDDRPTRKATAKQMMRAFFKQAMSNLE